MKTIVFLVLGISLLLYSVQGGDGNSRNFVEWMKTVPQSADFGSGLKRLILNINHEISQTDCDQLTEQLNQAATKFPSFCNSGNEENDKKEFAAFLSIVGAETSFLMNQSFPCIVENGCPDCEKCSYNSLGKQCAQNPKKQYFGRGPLQLSWNYNYGDYSEFYYNDRNVLLNDPSLVTQNGSTCWSSAIWFWMQKHDYGGWCMPQASWSDFHTCDSECYLGPSKCSLPQCSTDHWIKRGTQSCHDAMQGIDGIGTVIAIINGGYDCCPSSTYGGLYGHTTFRVWWYEDIYKIWTGQYPTDVMTVPMNNCPLGKGLTCKAMTSGQCWYDCCKLST